MLTIERGCFFREFKSKNNFKPFSEKAIGNALTKLSSIKLIDRIKKKDFAPAGNNHIKYFYCITKLGEETLEYAI